MGLLTRKVGHSLQLLFPELSDTYGLGLLALSRCGHTLLVGVGHDLGEVLRVQGVEDVEEVVTRWALAHWVL